MRIFKIELIIVLSLVTFFFGCTDETDQMEEPDTTITDNSNDNNNQYEPIYFFEDGSLKSFNPNEEETLVFKIESETKLTEEIYDIAYDPLNKDFFGFTNYTLSVSVGDEYFESYNTVTKKRVKKRLCACRYHSVCFNTKTKQKIFIKYGNSLNEVIFQEVSSEGDILKESPAIDLMDQVANFIYVPDLNSFVGMIDNYYKLKFFLINADTYELQIKETDIENPTTNNSIGDSFNYSDLLFDKNTGKMYFVRSNGVYQINVASNSATKLETNWIEFFKSSFGKDEKLSLPMTIYYPSTNEIIVQGTGFFGSSSGNSKFFAINLTSKKAREIETVYHFFDRVYGFAVKD